MVIDEPRLHSGVEFTWNGGNEDDYLINPRVYRITFLTKPCPYLVLLSDSVKIEDALSMEE